MNSRLQKLEQARVLIFDKIIESIPKNEVILSQAKIVEIYLMLKTPNLLLIGKDNRHRVSNLNNQEIEDLLNILQQYSFIKKYERVCGDVFRIELSIKPKSSSMVISLKFLQNSKAA